MAAPTQEKTSAETVEKIKFSVNFFMDTVNKAASASVYGIPHLYIGSD